jgi:hypothetical protein
MSLEIELYTHLEADSAISDLVEDRIYPLTAPENCKTPYITYQTISNIDLTSLQGDNYANKTNIQLDIYSSKYSEVKSVLGAVKEAIYSFKYFPHNFNSRDVFESDTKLHRQLIQFKLNT